MFIWFEYELDIILFWRFLIVYQSVHPLTTTGLAPLLLLSILNLNMHIRLMTDDKMTDVSLMTIDDSDYGISLTTVIAV